MTKRKKVTGNIFFFISVSILFFNMLLTVPSGKGSEISNRAKNSIPAYLSDTSVSISKETGKSGGLGDIAGKKVGIITGTVYDDWIVSKYPKARISRFESISYLTLSLKSNKIDVAILDKNTANWVLRNHPDLTLLTGELMETPLGVGFNQNNRQLQEEFNAYLDQIRNDRTLEEMSDRWFEGKGDETDMPALNKTSPVKKIIAGVSVENMPYADRVKNQFVGFDIELLYRFAERNNYDLEIVPLKYVDLFSSVYTGKVDLVVAGIAISEKYAGQIIFSREYARSNTSVIATLNQTSGYAGTVDENPPESLLQKTLNGIQNLFRENQYELILKGLWTTIIISVFSALTGIFLGTFLCVMLLSKNKVLKRSAQTYITTLRGIPLVTLLLVCYYVVFKSANLDPVIVAIFAFGINSAAFVSVMFKSTLESINREQIEAGLALGFTRAQTFLLVILPQFLRKLLPVYKGEFVAIVKMTSIVGFIAVEDLTKVSDIIRSRSLETFSPLILATVIYFVIITLLTSLIGYIEINLDPGKRRFRFKKLLEE